MDSSAIQLVCGSENPSCMLSEGQPTEPAAVTRRGRGSLSAVFRWWECATGPKPVVKLLEQCLELKLCQAREVDRVRVAGTIGSRAVRKSAWQREHGTDD